MKDAVMNTDVPAFGAGEITEMLGAVDGEFSFDMGWLIAYTRQVQLRAHAKAVDAECAACHAVVEECIRTQAHLASNPREALSEAAARIFKRGLSRAANLGLDGSASAG